MSLPPYSYLIWSHEHSAWWGPERCGYVHSLAAAGRYTHEEALRICTEAMPGITHRTGQLPELPVRLEDMYAMHLTYRTRYPDLEPEPWE